MAMYLIASLKSWLDVILAAFTDVICVLILSLKLPPESNTKANNFTSVRMVLPKIAKWRRISVRARKVGFLSF